MRKANEPAYPVTANIADRTGLSKREKLAMEIYAKATTSSGLTDPKVLAGIAQQSLRAADIFFEQLEKNGNS